MRNIEFTDQTKKSTAVLEQVESLIEQETDKLIYLEKTAIAYIFKPVLL